MIKYFQLFHNKKIAILSLSLPQHLYNKGVLPSMNLLTDDLLVEAYLSAIDHHLDQRFIKLLWSEISTRQLNVNKIN